MTWSDTRTPLFLFFCPSSLSSLPNIHVSTLNEERERERERVITLECISAAVVLILVHHDIHTQSIQGTICPTRFSFLPTCGSGIVQPGKRLAKYPTNSTWASVKTVHTVISRLN